MRTSLNKTEAKRSKPYPASNASGTASAAFAGASSSASTMPFRMIGTEMLAPRASTRNTRPAATR